MQARNAVHARLIDSRAHPIIHMAHLKHMDAQRDTMEAQLLAAALADDEAAVRRLLPECTGRDRNRVMMAAIKANHVPMAMVILKFPTRADRR